jgi:hypothetical protein
MTRRTLLRLALATAVLAVPTGCSGAATESAPPAQTTAAPSTASPASPSAAPRKADDERLAAKALVTAKDLGKPWIKPKSVNSTGSKGELCPGKPNVDGHLKPLAGSRAGLVQGKQTGANIGVFTIRTYPEPPASTFGKAWERATAACTKYQDAAKLYVVTTSEGPTSVSGADETFARVERIYYDADHKLLAYARQILAARQGRVVSEVEYAFLTTKADPKGKDFTTTEKLLSTQLAKTSSVFGQ